AIPARSTSGRRWSRPACGSGRRRRRCADSTRRTSARWRRSSSTPCRRTPTPRPWRRARARSATVGRSTPASAGTRRTPPDVLPVTEVTHPLVRHKLGLLRDRETDTEMFRRLVNELTLLLTYEATKDMGLEEVEVETPLERTTAQRIPGKKVAVCPILRAGVGMLDGVLSLVPVGPVGSIGLYRNEETLQPVEYYVKLPADVADRDVPLLDPMLATGNSTAAAVTTLKNAGASSITLISLIAAPEGVRHIQEDHPDVNIVVASIDSHLNEKGFIVPGLGDAGDRLYGTK